MSASRAQALSSALVAGPDQTLLARGAARRAEPSAGARLPQFERVKGRILIVCPRRGERIRLERVLAQEGYEVVFAETAERALQRTSQERFDLLIAEERLPVFSGLELVRALAAQPARPEAILLCDSPTPEAERLARELGAHAYLARPFQILALLSACDSGVRAAQLRSKKRLVH